VGPAADLPALGIPLVADLPVGKNLHDHLQVGVSWRATRPLSTNGRCRDGCIGSGGYAAVLSGNRPDVQLIPIWNPSQSTYRQIVVLLQPASRGELRLRSRDPNESPILQPRYLSDSRDSEALVNGLKLARSIGAATALLTIRGNETAPGPAVEDEASLHEYIAKTAWTMWHPVGTCRMGEDKDAVVDSELRVRRVQGLRVVDASVIPEIPSANTNAPTIMIAEKAADIIRAGAK
jgi:choline dehydrogenase